MCKFALTGCQACFLLQAKHQPLQFLNISTLREYLRFEFRELVGDASDPPPALDLGSSDPWHQDEDLPEPAPGDNQSEVSSEGIGEAPNAADTADQDNSASGSPESNGPNSISAETSLLEPVHPMIAGGQFEFERVLQDFVLLTFLVGLLCFMQLADQAVLALPIQATMCLCIRAADHVWL